MPRNKTPNLLVNSTSIEEQRKQRYDDQSQHAFPEAIVETRCPWYVISTVGGSEAKLVGRIRKKVDDSLYEHCWIPTKTIRRKYKRVYRDMDVYMFTGYVMVSTNTPKEFFLAMREKGDYVRILGDSHLNGYKDDEEQQYFRLKDWEVELMMRLAGWTKEEEKNLKHLKDRSMNVSFSTGIFVDGKLRVIDGPLKELEKYVVFVDRHKCMAKVRMELFGQVREFTLGVAVLDSIKTS